MTKQFITTILFTIFTTSSIYAEDLQPRWDNNVLRGHICAIDSVQIEENGLIVVKKIKKPLESAAVMLFKSKKEAEAVFNKFEGMINLYDSLKSYRDSSQTLNRNGLLKSVSNKIHSFTKLSRNRVAADRINTLLDSAASKANRQDSSLTVEWLNMFKEIDFIYNEDCREISTVTKFGSETDSSGRFDILSTERDKPGLRYLLAGLMGYNFSLHEINTALPDTIYLDEKTFSFRKVIKEDKAEEPFKPVFISKGIKSYEPRPQPHEFDPKPYFNNVIKPLDLSIGFFDYCWYYTYITGSSIGSVFTSAGKPQNAEKNEPENKK